MKFTEKKKVLEFVRSKYPDHATTFEIAKWAVDNWIAPETCSRRLRELRREGYVRSELAYSSEGKLHTKFYYIPPPKLSREEEERQILQQALM